MIKSVQSAKRVAFQGEPGAYANLAAREAIPHAQAIPKPSFEDAIEAVKTGECDLCIIPVENSLIGRIADIHHLFPDSGLHIVGEHFLPIHHQLLGLKDATLDDVKSVYSQAPALAQCRGILRDTKLVVHAWYDTAGSAKHVAELGDKSAAAIASTLAGEFYGLKVLKPDVEDEHHNVTRFLIMSREDDRAPNTGKVVTSFVFQVKNVPAALYKALGAFATNGVNMTRLESYQMGGSFNATQFYADIQGHPGAPNVAAALKELEFQTARMIVMGVYPAHSYRDEYT
ncbi:MAG TPA: prephenate dehydratase [Rhizomicrobium sp.]|nr:prephenate dehydratase [Rhizomicrobium sp.]HWA70036.1 prephenate dehydratase [Rhizomicrobium sp.]